MSFKFLMTSVQPLYKSTSTSTCQYVHVHTYVRNLTWLAALCMKEAGNVTKFVVP